MFKRLYGSVLVLLAIVMSAQAWALEADEGIEYKLVKPPVPTSVAKGKVEVVEMFWYGCPHCYHLESKLDKWKATLAKDVEFVRIPAVFDGRPAWELHARAYYTAELLGILDKVHPQLFAALHERHERLFSVDALAEFFRQFGVDPATFKDTMFSFGVEMKLNRARDLSKRYGIDGVPTIIVDGQYRTHASLTNGQDNLLKMTDFLIDKARSSHK